VDRAYLASARAMGALLCAIGVAMVVTTVARGGGPLAFGIIFGLIFIVLGALRLKLARAAANTEGGN
jgi:hypothetical protein